MPTYSGVYEAKCVRAAGEHSLVQIPQIYGPETVMCHDYAGSPPVTGEVGLVTFVNGDAAYPVWLGKATITDLTTVEGSIAQVQQNVDVVQQELTNHIAAVDPHPVYLTQAEGDVRYVNVDGDTMTGGLSGTTATFTGTVSAEGQRLPKVTVSTSLPSGGTDGDVWYVVS